MLDAHHDWTRLSAAHWWQMAIALLIAGGFLVMAATAALLVLWRVS